jgi:hypothetical protein
MSFLLPRPNLENGMEQGLDYLRKLYRNRNGLPAEAVQKKAGLPGEYAK